MNNSRWRKLFLILREHSLTFRLKTLISESIITAQQIYEIEQTAVLVDNNGDFIEFFEVEKIILPNKPAVTKLLSSAHIRFTERDEVIEIPGYVL